MATLRSELFVVALALVSSDDLVVIRARLVTPLCLQSRYFSLDPVMSF